MPTYQYTCTACDHQLEAVQSFSDDPLSECPDCSGRLRKVFSAVGVVFKGSGFYRTDSRAATRGNDSNGSGGSGESSKTGSDTSTSTKAAKGSGGSDGGTTSASKDSSKSPAATGGS